MARPRPSHVPAPRQLTLDDWAQMLNASRAEPEAPHPAATTVNTPASGSRAEMGRIRRGSG